MTVSEAITGEKEASETKEKKSEDANPGQDFVEAKNITENKDNIQKPINEVIIEYSTSFRFPEFFESPYV